MTIAGKRFLRPPQCSDRRRAQTFSVTPNMGALKPSQSGSPGSSFMMYPAASVSGYYFSHPESRYFNLGKIGKDQLAEYAKRKNLSFEHAEKLLGQNLNYG